MFVHKKSAKMSKFSLIILIRMSECWEALFLSNLSMYFFMSSILTSEKRNVSFSQWLALYCKYAWMVFVFKDSFKSWICHVDSPFKIDEISTNFPRGISTSNRFLSGQDNMGHLTNRFIHQFF